MPEIEPCGHPRLAEDFEQEALDLYIGLDTGMTVDLGTDLQGLAGGG